MRCAMDNILFIIHQFNEILYRNSMFFAIVLAAIFGKLFEGSRNSIYKMWVTFFVGTFAHELSHFLVGVVTLGFPYKFSIIPHRGAVENSYVMGHVKCYNMKWYNRFWISMAPLLLLPLAFLVFKSYFNFFESNIHNFFIWIFILVSLIFSSIPSGADFNNLKSGNLTLNLIGGFLGLLIVYILYYIGVIGWFQSMIMTLIK